MKRQRESLNKACIVSIIVLIVLAIVGSILIHRFEYVAGTRNDVHFSMVYGFGLSLIFFFVMIPIAACASILALISLVLRHSNVSQILMLTCFDTPWSSYCLLCFCTLRTRGRRIPERLRAMGSS